MADQKTSSSSSTAAASTGSGGGGRAPREGGPPSGKAPSNSANKLINDDGNVKLGKGLLVITLSIVALLGWGAVFFNGVCINSLPFRQMINLVSVQVPGQRFASARPSQPAPSEVPDAAALLSAPKLEPVPAAPVPTSSQEGEPAVRLANEPFASFAIPESAGGEEPKAVNISRVKLYLGVLGITSDWKVLIGSWFLGFMGYPYTNLLLLTWLSATLGSLVNYTVLALRQSSASQGKRGAGRMFYSLTGSIVVGVGLGFTMYVAIVGGATVITKSGLSIASSDDYANKAGIISLLTLLAALFPGWFLSLLETRLRDSKSNAPAATAQSEAGEPPTPTNSPTTPPTPAPAPTDLTVAVAFVAGQSPGPGPARLESSTIEIKGHHDLVSRYSAELVAGVKAQLL